MIRKKPTEERPDIDIPLSLKTDRIETQSLSEADLQKRKEWVRQFLSVFFKLFLLALFSCSTNYCILFCMNTSTCIISSMS